MGNKNIKISNKYILFSVYELDEQPFYVRLPTLVWCLDFKPQHTPRRETLVIPSFLAAHAQVAFALVFG